MKTDSQLQHDVIAALEWDPSLDAEQIGVEVNGGIVTLCGRVASYTEKLNAESAAQRVSGVRALAVEMEVRLPGASQRNDVDIARAAEGALQWMTYLPKDAVKVMVENGWVSLTGELEWDYQKQAAVGAVRHLRGVLGVSDRIALHPAVSIASTVTAEIVAALKRQAEVDAQKISVAVEGSDVTLTGIVKSWAERDSATGSAWGTPGVRKVVDNLTIDY